MKQPGQPVAHGGEDFLCVEGGFNAATRTVTLLAAPDSTTFPARDESQPVDFGEQGHWHPVAKWSPDDLLLPDPRHHDQRELASDVIERYLEDHGELPDMAFAVCNEMGFVGSLIEVMPQGVAAELHDNYDDAAEASDGQGVVAIHDISRFLTHMAREGYAGVLWNGAVPVFFCIDDGGELQFLRVGDGGGGKVSMEILDLADGWQPYDGAEEIEFLDNADACDARLVETIGSLPLLDWPDDHMLWSMGPSPDTAGVVSVEEDGLDYVLVFTNEDACRDWCTEEIDADWSPFLVHDLSMFLAASGGAKAGCLLNPGAHRARRGVMWKDGERIVLDSFSGFWELGEEGFSAIADEFKDDDSEQVEGS